MADTSGTKTSLRFFFFLWKTAKLVWKVKLWCKPVDNSMVLTSDPSFALKNISHESSFLLCRIFKNAYSNLERKLKYIEFTLITATSFNLISTQEWQCILSKPLWWWKNKAYDGASSVGLTLKHRLYALNVFEC